MAYCYSEDAMTYSAASKPELGTVYLYAKYCNLKCRHCWINPPHSDTISVKEGEAPLGEIISALEECRELGMKSVKLTGGEPFTRRDIFELLDYLKKNSIKIIVETNGTLIREKEARALKDAGAGHVSVSLDGPNDEVHASLRGMRGSFDSTVEGIKALVREDLNVQVIASLWRGNNRHMKSIITMSKALGAGSIKINLITDIERAGTMRAKGEVLSVRETIEFYRELSVELEREGVGGVIFDIPPAFHPVKNMSFEQINTCGIFNILGILGDGRISICGIGSSLDTLVLGRIMKDRIKDIWLGHPVLREIREGVPAKLKGICGKCMMKKYCLGKCRAEAYYTDGSLLAPLEFCQAAYEEGLFPLSRMIN